MLIVPKARRLPLKQRTHTWLAIRAIALLEEENEVPGLVRLLKPHIREAAIGSWIPDLADARKGFGDIDNHVFKLKPYHGSGAERFIRSQRQTLRSLGNHRQVTTFVRKWGDVLDDAWWQRPYRADPPPGQHLANRSMALFTTLIDQLILGDPKVARLVPGAVRFASNLDPGARPRTEEIATYCFMLSHFVADACQPFHCDARPLAGYSAGVHKELEAHWDRYCGPYFDKKRLLASGDSPGTILKRAREIDEKLGIRFSGNIPDLSARDLWLEVVYLCRASFAVCGILVPPGKIPYGSRKHTTYREVFQPDGLLQELDRAILHDSVLNISIAWKAIWRTFAR